MAEVKENKLLNKISKISIYFLVFLLPIFFLPFTQNVLDFPKQVLLLVLVSFSLFFFIIKTLLEGKLTLNFHPFNFLILIFVLIFGLSTLFSKARGESFFGFTLPISETYLTLLLLVFAFWLIINLFEKREIFYLLVFFLISVFLVEIFSLFQIFKKYLFPFDFTKTPSFTLIGSQNALAIFLACLLPLILVIFSLSKRFFKIFFFFQILLTLFLLVLINLKIAWSLVVFSVVLFLSFWATKREIFGKTVLISFLIFLSLSILFLFFNFSFPFQFPPEISLGQKISFQIALKSLKENPILGTGPATFVYNFSKYNLGALNDTIFWNFRFPNSASKFTDILATSGILGTISFLVLIFFPIFIGFSQFFKSSLEKIDLILFFAIFFSLVSFSLSFFLYFPNLTFIFSYLLLLSSLFSFLSKKIEIDFEKKKFLSLVLTFLFVLILIFNFGILILIGQRYAAEVFYLKGIKEWQRQNKERTISNLEKAIKIYPKVDLYYRDLSQVYLAKAMEKIQRGETDIQFEIANALSFANLAQNLNPKNVANWSVRAFTYESLIGIASGAEDWAIKCYEEAIKLEPSNPYFLTRKGVILVRKGILSQNEEEKRKYFEEAQESFQKAINLKSDYAPAHFQLAVLWQTEGKIDQAISKLEETKNLAPFDIGLAFQLGVAYYQKGDFQKAKEELERATILDPNYANALYFLGLTYDQLGERDKAIEKFQKVSDLNPDVEEVKKIISNLKAGKRALEGVFQPVPPQAPIQEKPPEIKE